MLTGRGRYEDIRNLYINHLAHIWMEDSTPEATRVSVEEKVDCFAEGDLEHAGEILSGLWEIANKEEEPKLPDPKRIAMGPAYGGAVRTALIGSIRGGVFFDRQFWARHSKAGDVKPVYFSSTIMADKSQQLKKRRSKFCHNFVEALNVHSGELCQESEHSGERPRGVAERGERLRKRLDGSFTRNTGGEEGKGRSSYCFDHWIVCSVRALSRFTVRSREMRNFTVGSPCSSIAALVQSRSPPSNRKVSTLG